jgi:hypothetical protein
MESHGVLGRSSFQAPEVVEKDRVPGQRSDSDSREGEVRLAPLIRDQISEPNYV